MDFVHKSLDEKKKSFIMINISSRNSRWILLIVIDENRSTPSGGARAQNSFQIIIIIITNKIKKLKIKRKFLSYATLHQWKYENLVKYDDFKD